MRPSTGRRLALRYRSALLAVLVGFISVGCTGASGTPRGPSDVARSLANGELAAYFAPGQAIPAIGPFQAALLKKPDLTFGDYQSAMQAAADCIGQKVIGASAQLRLLQGWTDVYQFAVASGGGANPVDAQSASADFTSLPIGTSSSEAGTTSTIQPSSPVLVPPRVAAEQAAVQAAMGYCIATYSVQVDARWRSTLILVGPELASQRPLFLQCMQAAGIVVPANTDNQKLGRIFGDPSTYQRLSVEQAQQSDACTTRFQQFLFSISPP